MVESPHATKILHRSEALSLSFTRFVAVLPELSTADFIARYASSEIEETLDSLEWLGEYRLLQSIQDEIDALRALRFND